MNPRHSILLLITSLSGFTVHANDTLTFPSPDKKWTIIAIWISDRYRYDWELKNLKTGKTYFGLKGSPADNEIGCKNLNVVWSPDSHYAAINCVIGRITEDVCLVKTDGNEPIDIGAGWENTLSPNETFEVSLLKEKDKKRFDGWQHLWVDAQKWLNNSDLLIEADMGVWLKPAEKQPKERVDVSALITVHFDKSGNGHIVRHE